jgi:arylsulfatase A-like enzyme
VPTGNVDIAPTVLRLAGLPVPPTMQGRVIAEGLRDTSASPTPVQHRQVRAATADGRYQVTAFLSVVNGHEYLDYTEVVRH